MDKGNEQRLLAALEALFSPAGMPAAFPPAHRYPLHPGVISCEHQGAGWAKSSIHDAGMQRLQEAIAGVLLRADLRHSGGTRERTMERAMGKFGMQHSGKDRAENKREAVRIVRALALAYEAHDLTATLDAAWEARENEHDLCDALLLVLQVVDRAMRERGLAGPLLGLGIDPGTRNLAVCVIDALGLAPRGLGADGKTPRAPLPIFSVRFWALIDLEPADGSPFVIKVQLPHGPTPHYVPPLAPPDGVDDPLEQELSFKHNRDERARKRRNAQAKEKRAAKKAKLSPEEEEAARLERNAKARARRAAAKKAKQEEDVIIV